jgi:UPF0042 nucleotide-binding protein
MSNIRILIITGLSGSGKSTAIRALEDIGFFCVDNLPVVLLPDFLEIQAAPEKDISRVAMVMDLREKGFIDQYPEIFKRLQEKGYRIEILFLDSTDDALVHRFSETRRVHPLGSKGSILEGVLLEREKLAPLKQMAERVIDTSSLNVHQLKDTIQRLYLPANRAIKLAVNIYSFGYRYGVPADADLVFDVRFLQNPYFIEDLKHLTGNDVRVREYVLGFDESRIFILKMFYLMAFLVPLYDREGKSRLCIAMGCTGGKHRSVVMANMMSTYFTEQHHPVSVTHRDVDKS